MKVTPDPETLKIKNVDDDSDLDITITGLTSDFPACVIEDASLFDEEMKELIEQIESPGIPGLEPEDRDNYTFKIIKTHEKDDFSFIPRITFPGGELFGDISKVNITCGLNSTTIIIPEVHNYTKNMENYLMISPN